MKNLSKMIAISALALFAWGCGNSPEKVCKKMADLEEKGAKDKDKKKADSKDMDKCVKEMADMKEKDPETFKCVATCSDMSDYDGAMGCLFACMLKSKDVKGGLKDDKDDKK